MTDLPELRIKAKELLSQSHDWLAFWAGGHERFYYLCDCQRTIKGLLKVIDEMASRE